MRIRVNKYSMEMIFFNNLEIYKPDSYKIYLMKKIGIIEGDVVDAEGVVKIFLMMLLNGDGHPFSKVSFKLVNKLYSSLMDRIGVDGINDEFIREHRDRISEIVFYIIERSECCAFIKNEDADKVREFIRYANYVIYLNLGINFVILLENFYKIAK